MDKKLICRHEKYDAMIKFAQAKKVGKNGDDLLKMMLDEYSTYLAPIVLYHEKKSIKAKSYPLDYSRLIPELYECKAKVFDEAIIHSIRVLLDRVSLMYWIDHKKCFNKEDGFGTYNSENPKQCKGFISYAKNNHEIDLLRYVSEQYDAWIHNICTNDNNLKHNGSERIGYNKINYIGENGIPEYATIITPSVYSSTNKSGNFNAEIPINDITNTINKAYEFADKIILSIISPHHIA